MNLYIPQLGDRIQLTKDWTFEVSTEGRNATLIQHITGALEVDWNGPTKYTYTIPAGATLQIDRIYIRQGQSNFDSITFSWIGVKTKGGMVPVPWNKSKMQRIASRTVRFWVKLAESRNIEFTPV